MLREGIEADPLHSVNGMTVNMYFAPKTETKVYQDDKGIVVFLNASPVVRLRAQFCTTDKARARAVILQEFPKLAADLKSRGCKEIIFESIVPEMIGFFCKNFGFKQSRHELRLDI